MTKLQKALKKLNPRNWYKHNATECYDMACYAMAGHAMPYNKNVLLWSEELIEWMKGKKFEWWVKVQKSKKGSLHVALGLRGS